jgi:hypothetical protein
MKQKVNDELKKHFRPEFLNRIDDIIVFNQLTKDQIIQMVDLMITRVETQLRSKDMGLELTPLAKQLLAKRGFDPVLGARPLRRTIQREIEDQLSEKILFGELQPGQIIVTDVEGWDGEGSDDKARFVFRGEPKPSKVPDVPPMDMAASTGVAHPGPHTTADGASRWRGSGRPPRPPRGLPPRLASGVRPRCQLAGLAPELAVWASAGLGLRGQYDLEFEQAGTAGDGLGALAGVRLAGTAVGPRLEVLLGFPTGVDEVPVVAGDRAQQLEPEESGCRVDGAHAGAEALLQFGPGIVGHLDRVDLHDGHAISVGVPRGTRPITRGW